MGSGYIQDVEEYKCTVIILYWLPWMTIQSSSSSLGQLSIILLHMLLPVIDYIANLQAPCSSGVCLGMYVQHNIIIIISSTIILLGRVLHSGLKSEVRTIIISKWIRRSATPL